MERRELARSCVNRKMRYTKHYERVTQELIEALVADGVVIPEDTGEEIVGVYRNEPGDLNRAVAITTDGFHFKEAGEWRTALYSDIIRVGKEHDWKDYEDGFLDVKLADGQAVKLPFCGGNPETCARDAALIVQFMPGPVSTRRRSNEP